VSPVSSGSSGPPGLQEERTALAWQRTGVSASAASAVGLVAAAHGGRAWVVGLTATVCVACAACTGVVARLRGPDGDGSPWARLVATAVATGLLCVTGLVLAAVALAD
jgi:hypothetical protein